jgi:hypothetical protein
MSAIPTEPPRSELIDTLIDAPERYVDTSYNMIFSITDEQRERLWIEGARRRFAEMRPKIAMLETLAARQGIDAIATLDDLAPLLFKASTYNSYPLSWLEKGDFERLTRWLDKLTAVDLSHVNMAGVELIEEWFAALAISASYRRGMAAVLAGRPVAARAVWPGAGSLSTVGTRR